MSAQIVDLGKARSRREADGLIERIKASFAAAEARALALPPGREKDVALSDLLTSEASRVVESLLDRARALGGSRAVEEEVLFSFAQAVGWQAEERGLETDLMQDSIETGALMHARCHEME